MKFIIRVIVIGIVMLAAGAGLWVYLNGSLIKSKASESVVRFAFSETVKKVKGGDTVEIGLTATADTGISGLDLIFETKGDNLNYLYQKSTSNIPIGFDAYLLDEAAMTKPSNYPINQLWHIILVSKKPENQLPTSVIIPLHFAIVSKGKGSETSTLTLDLKASKVSGHRAPGNLYSLSARDADKPVSFSIELDDARAAMVVDLACDNIRNASTSLCGRGAGLKWTDVANEEGYKVYKNGILFKTLGKDANSLSVMGCPNFNQNTYSVIAYNAFGSVSSNLPTVSCACNVCPTPMPPTPTPIRPENSADLIFRVVFPDVALDVNEIPNVTVLIFDNFGRPVCDGGTNCSKVVSFQRVVGSRIPNTFRSPQLQYPLKSNQAYSIVIKHIHSVQQTYKHIYLKWQKVLECLEGTKDTGCGELIEVVDKKPLFFGDLNGDNIIDQSDAEIVAGGMGANSAEGDLNFDGATDQKDVEILGKNFSKKGT